MRFRLRHIFLAFALVGLAITLYTLAERNRTLQTEVDRLRLEQGYLEPADLSKVNLIAAPTNDPQTYRWRLYIPEGTSMRVAIATHRIPRPGAGAAPPGIVTGCAGPTSLRGALVTAASVQNADGRQILRFSIAGAKQSMSTDVSLDEATSPFDIGAEVSQAGSWGVETLANGVSLELLGIRCFEPLTIGGSGLPDGPSRGVQIVLTPMPTSAVTPPLVAPPAAGSGN